jgi:hypothetical protein
VSARTAELLVSEVEPIEGGILLRGIVNRGAVHVADVVLGPERMGRVERAVSPSTLRVERITTYRRAVDTLPEGMTGELCCMGEVQDGFAPDMLVRLTQG